MLKFLLILFLVIYVIYKVGGLMMRIFLTGMIKQQQQTFHANQQRAAQFRRPADGKIHVDFVPENSDSRKGKKSKPDEDYVDFEEVK